MNHTEFDKFAEEYAETLTENIGASGEGPEYFAEYKVQDVAREIKSAKAASHHALDFGCGIGGSIPYFKHYFPETELTGLDVSKKSIDIALARFPHAAIYKTFDGKSLPFADGTFDIVFTACVFHHIPADLHVALLAEIRRVLTPKGRFFIFEHNPLNPLTLRVVARCPFDENAVLMTARELRARMGEAGFRHIKTNYRIFFPHLLRALRGVEALLTWCPFGAQYYLVAEK